MAWGQEKGTDVKISALPVSMRFFDFVPCSLPLKTLILLTFLCFLIRRRGKGELFAWGQSSRWTTMFQQVWRKVILFCLAISSSTRQVASEMER